MAKTPQKKPLKKPVKRPAPKRPPPAGELSADDVDRVAGGCDGSSKDPALI